MQNTEQTQTPELVDWAEKIPPGSRAFGFFPAFTLGTLAGAALIGGGFTCRPRAYHHWRDYYTCSPKFVCRPVPYYP